MKEYVPRLIRLVFGLFLFALGSFLIIQAHIGLAPWEAFSVGVSARTGLSFGNVVVLSGVIILIVDYLLKEEIGFGTIINTILIGKFVDLIEYFDVIPRMGNFPAGLAMLLTGQVVICLGSYFYIGSGLGCGPRDALMVALGKRLPRVPIGAVRGGIEALVLAVGWLLGAKVGLGTVVSVFGIGFILQYTFRLLRFDVKGVRHESISDTIRALSHDR